MTDRQRPDCLERLPLLRQPRNDFDEATARHLTGGDYNDREW